jgi:hypothetical protein
MENKLVYLKQLIDLIIAEKNEGNKKKLWSLTAKLSISELGNSRNEKEIGDVINEIHELCYEQNIRFQGLRFYSSFPHKPLIGSLTDDFIEMEHCRRRDEFERFCFALYQQIENIVNYLVKERTLWVKARNDRHELAFTYSQGTLKGQKQPGTKVARLVKYIKPEEDFKAESILDDFFKKSEDKLSFKEKFNLVLYYVYFNTIVKDKETWWAVYQMATDLYLIRNKNHRGEVLWQNVIETHERIEAEKYRYYLSFTGFLADFVHKICENNDSRQFEKEPIKIVKKG